MRSSRQVLSSRLFVRSTRAHISFSSPSPLPMLISRGSRCCNREGDCWYQPQRRARKAQDIRPGKSTFAEGSSGSTEWNEELTRPDYNKTSTQCCTPPRYHANIACLRSGCRSSLSGSSSGSSSTGVRSGSAATGTEGSLVPT